MRIGTAFLIVVSLGFTLMVGSRPGLAQTAPAAGQTSFGKNILISGSDPNGQSQNETAIAVNPANPSNLVAVFQGRYGMTGPSGCFFAFTLNGGKNWNPGGRAPLQRIDDECFDPSVAADAAGNFYYSYIDVDVSFTEADDMVAKSIDGGRTFATFSVAVNQVPGDTSSPSPDKDFIGVDAGAGSPFRASLYVGFTDFIGGGENIEVVVSRDGGSTWSAPVVVARPVKNERPRMDRFGALPVIAADGTVHMFYSEFPDSPVMGQLSVRHSRSTDGGATWSPPVAVGSGLPSPGFFDLRNADPQFGITPNRGMNGFTYPAATVAPDGTLYVAWVDFPLGSCVLFTAFDNPACSDADVRLSSSRDGGTSWSAPVKVSDDTGASDQFLPWIAAHPDGRLSLSWLDRRSDPSNISYDAFYTNTLDGLNFLPNVRISTGSSLLGVNDFIGHYTGLAVSGSSVFPVWGDTRNGSSDIFTALGKVR